MFRFVFVLLLSFPMWLSAQQGRLSAGFGAEVTDLNAAILNNSSSVGRHRGTGIFLHVYQSPGKLFSWAASASYGKLTEPALPADRWRSTGYFRMDPEVRLMPQALWHAAEKRYTLQIGLGYAVHVIPALKEESLPVWGSSAGYGIIQHYRIGVSSVFAGIYHHQRLYGDYRSFLTGRFGLAVRW